VYKFYAPQSVNILEKAQIGIVGAGLAGLTAAIVLARKGYSVILFEKKQFPYHKVCGEYVSNEVRPYLESLGLSLENLGAKKIDNFRLTSPSGTTVATSLGMGGFGLSRYTLDSQLAQLASDAGVRLLQKSEVQKITFLDDFFVIETADNQQYRVKYTLAAYGKRAKLDAELKRSFFQKKSPYLAVKYHIRYPFPQNLIALHNFKDGYCGISAIEGDQYCLCYLSHRNNLRSSGTIANMEAQILSQNPHLKDIFEKATFVYDKPLVINEISFEKKQAVEGHLLMIGDTAGLITPLNGNGMAMAIHAAKIATDLLQQALVGQINRQQLEASYQKQWQAQFASRLWFGRVLQRLFGNVQITQIVVVFLRKYPKLLQFIISKTHGQVLC
jgi:menaquinone-9 beta-reductase